MADSYYGILDIPRTADEDTVRRGFAKAALQWHPDVNVNNKDAALVKFTEICEAYDVLSNPQRRATYDQFGREVLLKGIPSDPTTRFAGVPPYTYHGDCSGTFVDFFGGRSPFSIFSDPNKGPGTHGAFGNLSRARNEIPDNFVERTLECTLEELYHGTTKKVNVVKREIGEDGVTYEVEKTLTVSLMPGYEKGVKVTFPKEGDQAPGKVPADLIFVIDEKKHSRFTRSGTTLFHRRRLPLARALTGTSVDIETLDGRLLTIPVNEVIQPGTVIRVPSEGMPDARDPTVRGDLVLEFDVIFPTYLTETQKDIINTAFGVSVKAREKAEKAKRRANNRATNSTADSSR